MSGDGNEIGRYGHDFCLHAGTWCVRRRASGVAFESS